MSNYQFAPSPEPDAADDQPQRKLAGKYESVEELEQGYQNALSVLTERTNQLRELQAQLTGSLPDQREMPTQRAQQRANERLEALGVPADAVSEIVREEFQHLMNPVLASINARSYMAKTYDNWGEMEDKLVGFLQQHPDLLEEYQRVYQGASPRVAIEWALDRYRQASAPERRVTNPQDAQMPPASPNRMNTQAEFLGMVNRPEADAWTEFLRTRNPREVLKQRLSGSPRASEGRGPY